MAMLGRRHHVTGGFPAHFYTISVLKNTVFQHSDRDKDKCNKKHGQTKHSADL